MRAKSVLGVVLAFGIAFSISGIPASALVLAALVGVLAVVMIQEVS